MDSQPGKRAQHGLEGGTSVLRYLHGRANARGSAPRPDRPGWGSLHKGVQHNGVPHAPTIRSRRHAAAPDGKEEEPMSIQSTHLSQAAGTAFGQIAQEWRSEFEGIVARTHQRAYRQAYTMTGNRDDAEDIVQEAYLRAYRAFHLYDHT